MARLIGLTGGIATGKTTVARMLEERGARVVDADEVARAVASPGTEGLARIAAAFGPEVLAEGGTLDRARLKAIVFADPEKRRLLEEITHPRIIAEIARRVQEFLADGDAPIVIEAALLLESGTRMPLDILIVVAAPPEVQLARIAARDALAAEEGKKILAAQMPTAEKIKHADYVIGNGGSLDETRRQVDAAWRKITGNVPAGA
jgi:dephospho-CoA kinase